MEKIEAEWKIIHSQAKHKYYSYNYKTKNKISR